MNPNPKNKAIRFDLKTAAGRRKEKAVKDAVWKRDMGVCQLCGRDIMVGEYHHVKFKSQGGGDELENRQLQCFDCHIKGIHGGGKDAQKLREAAVTKMEEINGKQM